MPYAAAPPALAILLGIVVGATHSQTPLALPLVISILSWSAAVLAFMRARAHLVLLAALPAYASAGCALAVDASRAVEEPTLRRLIGELRDDRLVILEGRLVQDAAPGPSGVSLWMSVDRVTIDGRSTTTTGGVLATVRGSLAPHRSDAWRAGRRIRMPASLRRPARYLNHGVPDQELSLARRGIVLVGSVKSAALVEVVSRGGWLAEWAAATRQAARRAIAASVGRWSVRSEGVVSAILIGDRAGLDADVERRLQEAGTYHVIAISGGNIAILAAVLVGCFRLLRIRLRTSTGLTVAGLVTYAYLVGGGASVNRATLMAATWLLARLGDHRTTSLNAVAVAAGLALAAFPLSIFDAGFALTFGATLAIVEGAGLAAARLRRLPRRLRPAAALLVASIAAEAAVFPIGACVFSRITFAGLLLNFLAIPLMTLAQIAGLAAVAAAAIDARAAALAGWVAHWAAAGLLGSATLVDLAPWLARRVPPPHPAMVALYYAGAITWVCLGRVRPAASAEAAAVRRSFTQWRNPAATPIWRPAAGHCPATRRIVAVLTVAGALVIVLAPPNPLAALRREMTLRVVFFDVGQGDATLVRFPGGPTLLVDAGGALDGGFDIGSRVLAPALWWLGVRRLDYLAVTHGDPDHIGGAEAIVGDFTAREIWEGVPVPHHQRSRALRARASRLGASWRTLRSGDRWQVGGADVRVWHPPPPGWERQRVRNDDSLVVDVRFGEVSILLTGDIGRDVERELIPRLRPAVLQVLKVAHHGSATSSSPEFLEAIRPAVAVISAGRDNRFGHPVAAVLERYRHIAAAIFRTDQDGAIAIETDGQTIAIRTFTGRSLRLHAEPRRHEGK